MKSKKRTKVKTGRGRTKTRKTNTKKKARPTKRKTLKKRYENINKYSVPKSKQRISRAQPRESLNTSANPVDIARQQLTVFKRGYENALVTVDNRKKLIDKRKKRWKKAKENAKKIGKGTIHLIEETGKIADKTGQWAERTAAPLTAFAAASENPLIGAAAGVVDATAGLYESYKFTKRMIDDTMKAIEKGDQDYYRKQLTSSGKYQKLMSESDTGAIVPYFSPETIDLPPPDSSGL